jgi:glycosyltransferase involved in cell wall biosynthesis
MRHYRTDPAKISVIYPGVEPRFHPFDPHNATEASLLEKVRSSFDLDRPFLLSIGTIEPRKNLATLIRAFAYLRQEYDSDHILVIAGGGGWLGERARLVALVEELDLAGHVRFTGFVEDDWLPALINLAEILLYPSLYEGFGFPILEALACGTPVITARNSSLPEAGGAAAHYVNDATDIEALTSAIYALLHDQTEQERMIRAGLKHAATFTWEATARRVIDLYRQALAA